ncbi:ABC transporter ATP-binding protein [Aliihoeflea sp. PC F10.4]
MSQHKSLPASASRFLAPTPPHPIIEAAGLTKSFNDGWARLFKSDEPRPAVNNATLAILPGEFVALVGESGSGKSTLGRMLLGLTDPDVGNIRYRGVDVGAFTHDEAAAFRREVQVVFQDSGASLNPRRTILSSVMIPLLYNLRMGRDEAGHRAAELLDRVGLTPALFQNRYPHELSGGQRQRVGLARAVASRPRLIIADEPVSALDVSVRANILSLMRDLQRDEGVAYLFITHDLGVVRALADRALVMLRGEIVEEGDAAQVIGQPSHAYTRTLVAATPVPDPRRRSSRPAVPQPS